MATIGSADIIDESILSADVKNGEVKNADIASSAITSAKIYNGSVINSELGLNAVTSDKVLNETLTGADIQNGTVGTADLQAPEAWQAVAQPSGCPVAGGLPGHFLPICYETSVSVQWQNDAGTTNNDTAFYKDPFGVVHLKGVVCRQGTYNCEPYQSPAGRRDAIFLLPAGYRPGKEWFFYTRTELGDALILIEPAGYVTMIYGNYGGITLDGIDFRACGAAGTC